MKFLLFLSLFFLVSCGGGGSAVASNSQPQNTQPETVTFKTVPDNLSIFE
jgi:hypothetical protein